MGRELEAKVDRTALIGDMTAKLKTASDRWAEVCRLYADAWKTAFERHMTVLKTVQSIKAERAQAVKDNIKTCLQLASVFLPAIGGVAALSLAPIWGARATLLAKTMERKAQAKWSEFATKHPIVSEVVREIGTRSAKEAQDAAAKIKDGIIDQLAPKYVAEKEKVPDVAADPLSAFIDKSKLTLDAMNTWVETCSGWNVKGGWESQLVPVAHELLSNHPWIKMAPPVQATQNLRPQFTLFLEMALWMRWARSLDEPYWREVHEWYTNEYTPASRNGKDGMVRGRARPWAIDALDFRVLWERMQDGYRGVHKFRKMTLLDPGSGLIAAERDTIDLYTMIKYAKDYRSAYFLERLLPSGRIDFHLSRELAKM